MLEFSRQMPQAWPRSAGVGMAESKCESDDPKAAFAWAEKRIQQTLNAGARVLSFDRLPLTELPVSFDQGRFANRLFGAINSLVTAGAVP